METEDGTGDALLRHHQHAAGNIQNGQWGGDVVVDDEDLRESRAPSIAYDLGTLSTEEEVGAALVRKEAGRRE